MASVILVRIKERFIFILQSQLFDSNKIIDNYVHILDKTYWFITLDAFKLGIECHAKCNNTKCNKFKIFHEP